MFDTLIATQIARWAGALSIGHALANANHLTSSYLLVGIR